MKKLLFFLLWFALQSAAYAGEDTKMFSLYPVPLKSSKLSVKRNTDHADNGKIATVELRNLIGKKLQSHEFDKNTEEVIFEDMDSYPNGIYVILAIDGYGKIIETAKFIINK
jgi:hypothetical protein